MEHDFRIDSSGSRMEYLCRRCGCRTPVFPGRTGPPSPADDCDEETAKSVLAD